MEHSHVPVLGLKASPKVFLIGGKDAAPPTDENSDDAGDDATPLRGVSQATHFVFVSLLRSIHESHSHSVDGFLNCRPKDDSPPAEEIETAVVAAIGFGADTFLGVSQATHLEAAVLFRSMQASHSHSLEDFLN